MFDFFKKKPENPPTKNQVKLCNQLGLDISPKMDKEDVSELIDKSLKQEKYRKIYNDLKGTTQMEEEERKEYGDKLYNEFKKWEGLCEKSRHFEIVFKQGSQIKFDIIELENVEITGAKKHYVEISLLFPKLYKDRELGNYLEWEKEKTLKTDKIIEIKPLDDYIDMYDVEEYKNKIEEGNKFEQATNS